MTYLAALTFLIQLALDTGVSIEPMISPHQVKSNQVCWYQGFNCRSSDDLRLDSCVSISDPNFEKSIRRYMSMNSKAEQACIKTTKAVDDIFRVQYQEQKKY